MTNEHTTSIESEGRVLSVNLPSGAFPTDGVTIGRDTWRISARAGTEPAHSEIEDAMRASGALVTCGPMTGAPPAPDDATGLLSAFNKEARGMVKAPGPFAGHPRDPRRNQARNVSDLSRRYLDGFPRAERFAAVRAHVPADVLSDEELMTIVIGHETSGFYAADGAEHARLKKEREDRERRMAEDAASQRARWHEAQEPQVLTPRAMRLLVVKVAPYVFAVKRDHRDPSNLVAVLAHANERCVDVPGGRLVFFDLPLTRNPWQPGGEIQPGVTALPSDEPLTFTPAELSIVWSRGTTCPDHLLSSIYGLRRASGELHFGPLRDDDFECSPETRQVRESTALAFLERRSAQLHGLHVGERAEVIAGVVRGCLLPETQAFDLIAERLRRDWGTRGPYMMSREDVLTHVARSARQAVQGSDTIASAELLPRGVQLQKGATDVVLGVLRGLVDGRESVSFAEAKNAIIAAGLVEVWNNLASRELTYRLRALGFERAFVDVEGRPRRMYVAGADRNDEPEIDAPKPAVAPIFATENPALSRTRIRNRAGSLGRQISNERAQRATEPPTDARGFPTGVVELE